MENDRGYVCPRHGRFVHKGEECPHCEKPLRAAAPRPLDGPRCGMPHYNNAGACGAPAVWHWQAISEAAKRGGKPTREFCDACHRQVSGGFMAEHWLWTAIDPGNAAPKETP